MPHAMTAASAAPAAARVVTCHQPGCRVCGPHYCATCCAFNLSAFCAAFRMPACVSTMCPRVRCPCSNRPRAPSGRCQQPCAGGGLLLGATCRDPHPSQRSSRCWSCMAGLQPTEGCHRHCTCAKAAAAATETAGMACAAAGVASDATGRPRRPPYAAACRRSAAAALLGAADISPDGAGDHPRRRRRPHLRPRGPSATTVCAAGPAAAHGPSHVQSAWGFVCLPSC
jgi:hypothetical protein